MNNSETPTGANGKKELKVTKSAEVENLLDEFFEDLREEGYGKIHINCLTFDVPPERTQGALKEEGVKNFEEVINNPEGKSTPIDPLQINAGRAIKAGKETTKNAKAYKKARDDAKAQSEGRRDEANKKIEKEKNSVSREER